MLQRLANIFKLDFEKRLKNKYSSISLQKSASIKPAKSPLKFDHFAEKSEENILPNCST